MNSHQPETEAGLLSWKEFVQQLQDFIDVVGQLDSSWSIVEHRVRLGILSRVC